VQSEIGLIGRWGSSRNWVLWTMNRPTRFSSPRILGEGGKKGNTKRSRLPFERYGGKRATGISGKGLKRNEARSWKLDFPVSEVGKKGKKGCPRLRA